MVTRIARALGALLTAAFRSGLPREPSPRAGECKAALTIYPSTQRGVRAEALGTPALNTRRTRA